MGAALGYKMEPIYGMTAEDWLGSPEEVIEGYIRGGLRGASAETTIMTTHDVQRGRPTEIADYINGLVVRKGREANVPTPMNEAIVELFPRLERGELRPDISNLDLLKLP